MGEQQQGSMAALLQQRTSAWMAAHKVQLSRQQPKQEAQPVSRTNLVQFPGPAQSPSIVEVTSDHSQGVTL